MSWPQVEAEESGDLITVVGSFARIHPGAGIMVKGEWKRDSKYGEQLRAVEYVETAPATQVPNQFIQKKNRVHTGRVGLHSCHGMGLLI